MAGIKVLAAKNKNGWEQLTSENMSVPKTKNNLFEQSGDNYRKLNELVDSFSEEEKLAEFPPGTMNRNIRDVLGHLNHWHLIFLDWSKQTTQTINLL